MSAAPPQISVIVPTYRESENIPSLTARVHETLTEAGIAGEIILSDDDTDAETRAVCAGLSARYPLRLLERRANRGLAPAVIDGIRAAAGDIIVVMDADLSHPPEVIPKMAALLLSGEADFVVGSRYVKGGGLDKNWPWLRRLNSFAATLPAKVLTPLADPMSGFFALRRRDMPAAEMLSPIGYKIGLELAVKGGFRKERIREVPIFFRDREHGESKMNLREQLNYLRHLRRLYHYRWAKPMEVFQFLAVGLLGLAIDVGVYLLLLFFGVPHLLARGAAYWPAVTSNWFVNRIMTFKQRRREPLFAQWGKYVFFSSVGFFINWGTYYALTTHVAFFAERFLLALFVGVLAGTAFNFLASDWLVFRRR